MKCKFNFFLFVKYAPFFSPILLVFVRQLCPNYFFNFASLFRSTLLQLSPDYAQRDYAPNFAFCPNYAPSFASTMFWYINILSSCLIYYSIQKQLTTKI